MSEHKLVASMSVSESEYGKVDERIFIRYEYVNVLNQVHQETPIIPHDGSGWAP